MAKERSKFFHPVLDPLERFSEILFGVIMVLTFTVSLRVARADRVQVREMLIGALGCNLAWGLIDAIMYIMSNVSERGHSIAILKRIHRAHDPRQADKIIIDELPPVVASVLPSSALEALRINLRNMPEPAPYPRLNQQDWRGALGVFSLVFLSTFPIILPFLVIPRIRLALHVSDAIAITMLFFAGYSYGRYAGHGAWGWGLSMVVIGGLMVGLTIGLGG
jgi:VIT family